MTDETTRTTYRSLRVSIVALALLLVTSLVIEMVRSGGRYGSISAFYYSPARAALVGSLVALGPALVAIRGRAGAEDVMLDLAGMLIPVVAFVPTSRDLGEAVCGPGITTCLPPELTAAIENNVAALCVVGLAVLAFAWRSSGTRVRTTTVGLLAATGLWLAVTVWFVVGRDTFLTGAHDLTAAAFFVLVAAVAWVNGRHAPQRVTVRMLSPRRYGHAYRLISVLMVLTILVAAGLHVAATVAGLTLWFATTLVVETLLLLLFVAFWVLQTAENWDREPTGAP